MSTPTRRHGLAAARRIAVELTPQTVEQIAGRVAALLRPHQPRADANRPPAQTWMTVKELAHHLKLNPGYIYEHAQELGAIRTGSGPKARIRFDLHTATQALKGHQRQPAPTATRPRRKPAPGASSYAADAPPLRIRNPYTRSIRGFLPAARRRGRLGVC